MANTIKIKNSSTAGSVPSSLEYGEIALNYTDGKIFYKNNSNTIVSFGSSFAALTKHLVKNDSGGTLAAGSAVYTYGANGTNILVRGAQANSEPTSATVMGLLETSLSSNETGYVITEGLLAGLNTSTATAGDPVWLSPSSPGGIVFGIANKPSAPNHLVYLGTVTRVNSNNGEIFVHILNGWELEELHNVSISNTVASNDVLKYDGTKWINDPTINQQISDLYIMSYMEIM